MFVPQGAAVRIASKTGLVQNAHDCVWLDYSYSFADYCADSHYYVDTGLCAKTGLLVADAASRIPLTEKVKLWVSWQYVRVLIAAHYLREQGDVRPLFVIRDNLQSSLGMDKWEGKTVHEILNS